MAKSQRNSDFSPSFFALKAEKPATSGVRALRKTIRFSGKFCTLGNSWAILNLNNHAPYRATQKEVGQLFFNPAEKALAYY
jgi:hypothetical protein